MAGAESPTTWEGDFRYVHGVDWMQWKTGGLSLLSVNGFTPVPSVKHDTTWGEGSHFYVWERTRQMRDTTFLISEISGPNADQPKKGYMAVVPYGAPGVGDTIALKWRVAVEQKPAAGWAYIQLREFAEHAFRSARRFDRARKHRRAVHHVRHGVFPVLDLLGEFRLLPRTEAQL